MILDVGLAVQHSPDGIFDCDCSGELPGPIDASTAW